MRKLDRVTAVLIILYLIFFVTWTIIGVLIYHTLKVKVYAQETEIRTELVPLVIEVEPIPLAEEAEQILVVEDPWLIDVTDEEIALMERVVMSEASVCDVDIKFAVASTIVNRVLSDKFPNTVTEVINFPNAYSTADNGEPTEDCKMVVEWALKYKAFPDNMVYFRTGHYHDFGYALFKLGNMYFSGV